MEPVRCRQVLRQSARYEERLRQSVRYGPSGGVLSHESTQHIRATSKIDAGRARSVRIGTRRARSVRTNAGCTGSQTGTAHWLRRDRCMETSQVSVRIENREVPRTLLAGNALVDGLLDSGLLGVSPTSRSPAHNPCTAGTAARCSASNQRFTSGWNKPYRAVDAKLGTLVAVCLPYAARLPWKRGKTPVDGCSASRHRPPAP